MNKILNSERHRELSHQHRNEEHQEHASDAGFPVRRWADFPARMKNAAWMEKDKKRGTADTSSPTRCPDGGVKKGLTKNRQTLNLVLVAGVGFEPTTFGL
jgi:hypothetical protein